MLYIIIIIVIETELLLLVLLLTRGGRASFLRACLDVVLLSHSC